MCGIVGYVGKRPAVDILVEGLRRLEYRGYDSAGIALVDRHGVQTSKTTDGVTALRALVEDNASQTHGIAHTRWATHGAPTYENAHPHLDGTGRIAVVHNGIVENDRPLRKFLQQQGVEFRSQTDTEVIAQLIGHFYDGNLEHAVRLALHELSGTYGIAVVCVDEPNVIIAARQGSPLIIGVGDDEHILASDATAIVAHTSQVVYLGDGEIARIEPGVMHLTTLDAVPVAAEVKAVECSLEQIELAGHDYFMHKEIFEQPETIEDCLRGRIDLRKGTIRLGGLTECTRDLVRAKRFILTGCGTAWHAALVGEYLFEEMLRVPTEVEYASELRYRNPIIDDGTVTVAVSQSGETADTMAAVEEAKRRGALTLGVVNAVGSSIARETDAGVYLHVGPEIGVASTKAFTGQVTVLALMACYLGRRRHVSPVTANEFVATLSKIPGQIRAMLEHADEAKGVAEAYCERENWLFLGRGYNYPVALEGALKLKEISYIHAEGLPAAEMKHGPLALITEGTPVVCIATSGLQYDKIISNMSEVRSRGGAVIAIATEGNTEIQGLADQVLYVPDTLESLQPLLTVIPLQLIAYHAAVIRGCNVDKPRNLAKSVTVE